MAKSAKNPPFRARLDRLQTIVEELENGDELDLEVALERFEEGRKLHAELLERLAGFEQRLEALAETGDGQVQAVALEGAEPESEDA